MKSQQKSHVQVTAKDPGMITSVNIKLHQKVQPEHSYYLQGRGNRKTLESQLKRRHLINAK